MIGHNKLLSYLINKGCEWISEQRSLHLASARQLLNGEKLLFRKYLEERTLNSSRIALVDRISNPRFYNGLIKLDTPILIDFSQSAGITFAECILIKRNFENTSSWNSLLFHELVHVVQYNILGIRKFVELYVMGWAQNGYRYGNIPLERQAYKLQNKFDQKESTFSIRQILKQDLKYFI